MQQLENGFQACIQSRGNKENKYSPIDHGKGMITELYKKCQIMTKELDWRLVKAFLFIFYRVLK
jgi:hypothetical protein